jgi:hypothetical protein
LFIGTQFSNLYTAVDTPAKGRVGNLLQLRVQGSGYMVEVGGRDAEDEWKTAKIICNTLDEVIEIVRETANMTRQD